MKNGVVTSLVVGVLVCSFLYSLPSHAATPTPTATPQRYVTAKLSQVSGQSVITCTVKNSRGRAVPSQIVSVQTASAPQGPYAVWMSKKTNAQGQALFPYAPSRSARLMLTTDTWCVRCAAAGSVSPTKWIKGKRPTPTPTPVVTPTATPRPTATPTPTVTPTATPRPTATPTPTGTPTPRPTATPTPVVTPTATPRPTATPTPTVTPTPTPRPTPTPMPSPTPSSGLVVSAGGPITTNAGATVTFAGAILGGTAPYNYSWNFGDGTTLSTGRNTASFTQTDTTTQGNWSGVYGTAGYNVIGSTSSYPSYATVTPSGQNYLGTHIWDPTPSDVRGLQIPGSPSGRIAACWYGTSFTIDVNLTDGQVHLVSLYAVDWDSNPVARSEQIQVLDGSSGAVLNTQTISNFQSGEYLTWNVSGHVQFTVTCLVGNVAVVSGLFIGPANTLTPTHTYYDPGTYNATLTVTDSAGHSANSSVSVTVNAIPPTATLSAPPMAGAGVALTLSASATEPSPVDQAAGYTYAWNFGDGSTGTGANPSHTYSSTGTYTISVTATSIRTGLTSQPVTGSIIVNTAVILNVPTGHQRLWWTPARIQTAQAWWANHSFVPAPDDAYGNAFAYVMTGNTTYGNAAVNLLMGFSISDGEINSVASDNYRWTDCVPVVFDWCHDLMTPTQISTFMARYNYYTSKVINMTWGGPGFEGNNYYWGYLRNELNWAIATYYENPWAQTFLHDALVTRWQNGVLPYFAGLGKGGVPPEGSVYGLAMLQYPDVAFTTLGLMGYNIFSQTNWYKEAVFNTIYDTSLTPINSIWTQFSYGPDQRGLQANANYQTYNGDFMTMMAEAYAGLPISRYAQQWLNNVNPGVDPWVAALNAGSSTLPFSNLPLDYYAPGEGWLYTKNTWASSGTSVLLQLGEGSGGDHLHQDAGTFQIYSGDQQVAPEHMSYDPTWFLDGTPCATTGCA